jgi:transposase
LSRSLVALDQDSTLIVVVEMSQSSWLVAGMVPGVERRPLKKLGPDEHELLKRVHRWRDEAIRTGRSIDRIVVGFETGRDGFWLARWLRAQGVECHVIHAASTAVSREHRRAKTDRLDTQMLMRGLLGWLRGETGHCKMAAIPTLEQEDGRRPSRERDSLTSEVTRVVNRMKSTLAWLGIRGFNCKLRKAPTRLAALRTPLGEAIPPDTLAELERDMARLALLKAQIKAVETGRLNKIKQAPAAGANAAIRLLAGVFGLGLETADLLANELFWRQVRDRRALARMAGLTGSPDESGNRRRGDSSTSSPTVTWSSGSRAAPRTPRPRSGKP